MIDVAAARADTPGCLDRVFLDSAGSSLPPISVVQAVTAHLRREAEVGGYVAAEERADDLAAVRTSIARLVNGQPSGVALMDSATRAWNQLFYSVRLRRGDRVLISQSEYASHAIAALHRRDRDGVVVDVIPSDATGALDVGALRDMLDERVRLVSLVHVPTNGGLVNPVAEAARAAHEVGALVLLDACQSIGQIAVDVAELDVDAVTGTGRKWLRGPRGTGFLYVRPDLLDLLDPPELDLHSAAWTAPDRYEVAETATRFELWESDVAARLGLGQAVDHLLGLGIGAVEQEVRARAARLRRGLEALPRVETTDLGAQPCGIVTFGVERVPAADVRAALARSGVTVTISRVGSTRLDMTARRLDAVVRASPHYFVDDVQLDAAIAAVDQVAVDAH